MGNNKGLVEYVKNALVEKWGYVWGTFGQLLTESLLQQKLNQYPDGVGNYLDFIRSNWLGRHVSDCVGLIKGFYWNGSYNSATDVSADGMLTRAVEKGPISTMPDIPGICVQKPGHIGVYIGNGLVIEAHGTKYGVIQTPLHGPGSTPWTNWLKCPYIEYVDEKPVEVTEPVSNPINNDVLELQRTLNRFKMRDAKGNALVEDGIMGGRTKEAIKRFQSICHLEVDGVAGPKTNEAINAILAKPLLQVTSNGVAVRYLQYRVGALTDGDFGWKTNRAVAIWQGQNGLDQDGKVGPKTWFQLIG